MFAVYPGQREANDPHRGFLKFQIRSVNVKSHLRRNGLRFAVAEAVNDYILQPS